jgi:pSer/pThr/pTyr-binding forkhead associated (FHA) protein
MHLYMMNGFEEGRWIALDGEPTTIGRSEGNTMALAHDDQVSGKHAEIQQRGQELWLSDKGSTHGTRINDRRVQAPVALQAGDVIGVGQTLLLVCREKGELPVMTMAIAVLQ